MSDYQIISRKEQPNFIANFWFLLVTAEGKADDDNDILLKHNVEGMFREWNRLFSDDLKPRWITRDENKAKEKS